MAFHQNKFITYFTSPLLEAYGIKHGFFTRHGGCSPYPWQGMNLATSVGDSRENVIDNRLRIFSCLGINPKEVFDVWQIHSRTIIVTERSRSLKEPHQKADGIITAKKNISLLMLFADCVPILFYDSGNKVIGIAHAGWQGTIKKIVVEMLEKLRMNFNSNPEKIICAIGPSICKDHYEIGAEVSEQVRKNLDFHEKVLTKKKGKIFLDLSLANEILLHQNGVNNVQSINICTAEHQEDWFSHRAEKGQAGRFGAVISMQN